MALGLHGGGGWVDEAGGDEKKDGKGPGEDDAEDEPDQDGSEGEWAQWREPAREGTESGKRGLGDRGNLLRGGHGFRIAEVSDVRRQVRLRSGFWFAEAVEDGLGGDGSAEEEAGGHAEDEGAVVLVDAVEDADGLEDVEAAEGDEGDSFRGFGAPESDGLGEEEEAVYDESEAEEDGDGLLHESPVLLMKG